MRTANIDVPAITPFTHVMRDLRASCLVSRLNRGRTKSYTPIPLIHCDTHCHGRHEKGRVCLSIC
jgi:hypothetical protein